MPHYPATKNLPDGTFQATCSCGWATKAPIRTTEAAAKLAGNHVRDKRKW